MKSVTASKFREQCLLLLDHLDPDGVVITKHGKAVARLVPTASGCADLIGSMKGKIGISSDVFSTGAKWGHNQVERRS